MKKIKVKLTFTEEILGTANATTTIHDEYIASKAPDAKSREEEIAALGVAEVVEKSMTVFPTLEDGTPFLWDYQVKGFFKDACGVLKKVSRRTRKRLTDLSSSRNAKYHTSSRAVWVNVRDR